MIEIRIRYKDRSENVINFAQGLDDEQLTNVFELLQSLLGNKFFATHPKRLDDITVYKKWPKNKQLIFKAMLIAKLNDTEIVDIFGVTKQYVSLIRKEFKEFLQD